MRYKLNVSLSWEVEAPNSKLAYENGLKQLTPLKDLKVKPKIQVCLLSSKFPNKKNKVLAEYHPDEIFSQLTKDGARKEFKIDSKVYKVKMNSDRYFCFKQNTKCVACGLEGVKFLLELPKDCPHPHLNFYAEENGEFVLMTKDHKMPVALGGKDLDENYQTMCAICNNLKGKDLFTPIQIKELRKTYNQNLGKNVDLHKVLETKRNKLRQADFYRYCWLGMILVFVLAISFYSVVAAIFGLVLAILGYCMRNK